MNLSAVKGCPGWSYGLRIRRGDDVEFSVTDGTDTIEGLRASPYRTTKLARLMGDHRTGYEAVAVAAIHGRTKRPTGRWTKHPHRQRRTGPRRLRRTGMDQGRRARNHPRARARLIPPPLPPGDLADVSGLR